ncbi:GNAT family N-acetyltransferase [Aspergillus clavatus NRRL 1]|uniref:GNAT family acetyltransferase, putative n=1 Tax=Aspergillus clavatus (strain ATCC 1007 / CBS 513.65 / DSM 816 / NCTC 3887 / NRRL 1 / QM 1276 / 107) TaxID=344612 RepID=A1CNH0_ASPCL|nr:GNAT family acetyltransferase, putative [Aspergillus clavatus NRRL 1]EAW07191.1 GNAT family acetyltransferase, putative [Aspergillus clavatus NRRL 1]
MTRRNYQIIAARSAEDVAAVRALFEAYADSLGIDLTFQSFQSELRTLPGQYGGPHGELLLAYDIKGKTALGCVAVRPFVAKDHGTTCTSGEDRMACCEMKRLYVSPDARGMGLGKTLVDAIIQKAKELGYRAMRLDTLSTMVGAQQLYRGAGFVEIQAYYETPLDGTLFLELNLTSS